MILKIELFKSSKSFVIGYLIGDSIRGIVISSSNYPYGYKGKWNSKTFKVIESMPSDYITYNAMDLFDVAHGVAELSNKN